MEGTDEVKFPLDKIFVCSEVERGWEAAGGNEEEGGLL